MESVRSNAFMAFGVKMSSTSISSVRISSLHGELHNATRFLQHVRHGKLHNATRFLQHFRHVMRASRIIFVTIGCIPMLGTAQAIPVAKPCPPATSEPFLRCQVDSPAVPLERPDAFRLPEYFDLPTQAEMVHVRYVTSASGSAWRPQPGTVVATLPTSARVLELLRWSLSQTQYSAATRNGARVAMQHDEIFVIVTPPKGLYSMPAIAGVRRDTTSEGIVRTTIGQPLEDRIGAAALTPADLIAAEEAVVAAHMRWQVSFRADSARLRTACVTYLLDSTTVQPSAEQLKRMSNERISAVTQEQCPKTYTVMIRGPGYVEPPPGNIDPYVIGFSALQRWSTNQLYVTVITKHGTSDFMAVCGARREQGLWKAYCGQPDMKIH